MDDESDRRVFRTQEELDAFAARIWEQHISRFGAWSFNYLRHEIVCGSEHKSLTLTEADILWDIVLSYPLPFCGKFRAKPRFCDHDMTMEELKTHIHRLRVKLAATGADIETIRGRGYAFVPPPLEAA